MNDIKSYISGLSLILLLASALLAGRFYLQWQQTPGGETGQAQTNLAEKAPAKRDEETPVQPFMPLPLKSYAEITQRPLFAEGRIPPETPTEEMQGVAALPPPDLKLEGVAITPESRTAVITDLRTSEVLRLSEGMSHQDWKLESVAKDSVTIRRGVQSIVLKLEIEENPASTAKSKPKLPFRLPLRRPPSAIPGK